MRRYILATALGLGCGALDVAVDFDGSSLEETRSSDGRHRRVKGEPRVRVGGRPARKVGVDLVTRHFLTDADTTLTVSDPMTGPARFELEGELGTARITPAGGVAVLLQSSPDGQGLDVDGVPAATDEEAAVRLVDAAPGLSPEQLAVAQALLAEPGAEAVHGALDRVLRCGVALAAARDGDLR